MYEAGPEYQIETPALRLDALKMTPTTDLYWSYTLFYKDENSVLRD